jgi:hypothetical protein
LESGARGLLALPQTLEAQLFPAQVQESVGKIQRAEDQAQLTEEANRFSAEQILPFAAAQDVAALAFGIGGGSATSTTTGSNSNSASPLGGALGGAAIGGSIGGPYGAAIGAAAGALMAIL